MSTRGAASNEKMNSSYVLPAAIRLRGPCAFVRPRVPCVSRVCPGSPGVFLPPPVSFYRQRSSTSLKPTRLAPRRISAAAVTFDQSLMLLCGTLLTSRAGYNPGAYRKKPHQASTAYEYHARILIHARLRALPIVPRVVRTSGTVPYCRIGGQPRTALVNLACFSHISTVSQIISRVFICNMNNQYRARPSQPFLPSHIEASVGLTSNRNKPLLGS